MGESTAIILFAEGCCFFILSLVFTTCFGLMTNNEEYYGAPCEGTRYLEWCKSIFVLHAVYLSISVCILPCVYGCAAADDSSAAGSCCSWFFRVSLIIGYIINFIGISVSYADNSDCGQLRQLGLAYIIIIGSLVGISFCACCCVCCCGLCLSDGSGVYAKLTR